GTATVTITKANPVITVTPYSVPFDNAVHTATFTAVGVESPTPANLAGLMTVSGTTHTNSGTYNNDPWSFAGNTNYNATSGTVNDAISKINAMIVVTGFSGTYNGNAHGVVSNSATGVDDVDLSSLLDVATTTYTDVPGGSLAWTFSGNNDYNSASGTATVTITKANPVITVTPYDVPYDALPHTATFTAVGVESTPADMTSLMTVSGTTHTDAGSYTTDSWSFAGNTNYNATGATITDAIGKANVTIIINGYTGVYDGAAHGATGSAIGAKGETLTGLVLGASFTNVPGGTANWVFTDVTGNYNDKPGSVNILINKVTLMITADAQTKTYGDIDPALTYTFAPALIGTDVFTGSLTRGAGEPVGSYAITTGTLTAGSNYSLSIAATPTFSITTRPLTIAAGKKTKEYDGEVLSGGYTVTYNGFITGQTESVLDGTLGFTGTAILATNVGDYVITPGGLTSGNYDISFVNGALDITRKVLTITAVNKSKCYDGAECNSFTVIYDGFVNGETEAALDGTLTFTGAATTAVNEGTGYVITPGGLTSGNYYITYRNGELTVNPFFAAKAGNDRTICLNASTTLGEATVKGNTYQWSSVSSGFTSNETNPTVSPLITTTYTLICSNGECISKEYVTVIVNPVPTVSRKLSDYNGYNISCKGLADGAIHITPTSEQASYVYDWKGTDGFTETAKDISNLKAGQFTLLITDNKSCSATEIINLTEPEKLGMILNLSSTSAEEFNINCAGESTGSIDIEPVNQVGTVNYLWDDGIFGKTRENLPAGTYSVSIKDANECQAGSIIQLSEPDSMKLIVDIFRQPFCPDKSDGEIRLNVTGGVVATDYSYKWSDNSTGSSYQIFRKDYIR
ncbi:MAG: MBG domain-containing protein, partial [Bacteroidota bacterium]